VHGETRVFAGVWFHTISLVKRYAKAKVSKYAGFSNLEDKSGCGDFAFQAKMTRPVFSFRITNFSNCSGIPEVKIIS